MGVITKKSVGLQRKFRFVRAAFRKTQVTDREGLYALLNSKVAGAPFEQTTRSRLEGLSSSQTHGKDSLKSMTQLLHLEIGAPLPVTRCTSRFLALSASLSVSCDDLTAPPRKPGLYRFRR